MKTDNGLSIPQSPDQGRHALQTSFRTGAHSECPPLSPGIHLQTHTSFIQGTVREPLLPPALSLLGKGTGQGLLSLWVTHLQAGPPHSGR